VRSKEFQVPNSGTPASLGPLIGGLLSYKTGGGPLKPYPYAPPYLVIAAMSIVAALVVFFGLEETLEGYNAERSYARLFWKRIKGIGSKSRGHEYAPLDVDEPSSSTV
jgi:hypothetical protein